MVYTKCLHGLGIIHRTSPLLTDTNWGSDEKISGVPWYDAKHVLARATAITGA